jgi:hypothetical protein
LNAILLVSARNLRLSIIKSRGGSRKVVLSNAKVGLLEEKVGCPGVIALRDSAEVSPATA